MVFLNFLQCEASWKPGKVSLESSRRVPNIRNHLSPAWTWTSLFSYPNQWKPTQGTLQITFMWVPHTLWCLLLTLRFICPFRRVAIGQCCVWLWRKPSRKPDHPSNFSLLRGLMHSDADRIRQVSSSCPRRRCSNVIKKNRLLSRHNWYIEGRLKNEKNSWAAFAPPCPSSKENEAAGGCFLSN